MADAPTVTPKEIARWKRDHQELCVVLLYLKGHSCLTCSLFDEVERLRLENERLRALGRADVLDLMSKIEGKIAGDPRHFKGETAGAHMLGASVRAALASPSPHTEEPAQQPKATHPYEGCQNNQHKSPCKRGCHVIVGASNDSCGLPSSDPIHAHTEGE